MRLACFALLLLIFASNLSPWLLQRHRAYSGGEIDLLVLGVVVGVFVVGALMVLYCARLATLWILLCMLAVSVFGLFVYLYGDGLGVRLVLLLGWVIQFLALITGFFVGSIYREKPV